MKLGVGQSISNLGGNSTNTLVSTADITHSIISAAPTKVITCLDIIPFQNVLWDPSWKFCVCTMLYLMAVCLF